MRTICSNMRLGAPLVKRSGSIMAWSSTALAALTAAVIIMLNVKL